MIILHKKWNNYTKIIKLKIDEKRSPCDHETSLIIIDEARWLCVWIVALIIRNMLFLVHQWSSNQDKDST